MKKKRKKYVTLIEVMIVILLIGIIGGALAFNMRGSMDEGRAFKTKQNQNRIHDILMLEFAQGDRNLQEIKDDWADIVKASPLVQGETVLKDGWGRDFIVTLDSDNEAIKVYSEKLTNFENSKRGKKKK